jgi:hypothetical protein
MQCPSARSAPDRPQPLSSQSRMNGVGGPVRHRHAVYGADRLARLRDRRDRACRVRRQPARRSWAGSAELLPSRLRSGDHRGRGSSWDFAALAPSSVPGRARTHSIRSPLSKGPRQWPYEGIWKALKSPESAPSGDMRRYAPARYSPRPVVCDVTNFRRGIDPASTNARSCRAEGCRREIPSWSAVDGAGPLVVRRQVDHDRQQVASGLTVGLAGIVQSAGEARYAVQARERNSFRTHVRPRAAS